MTKVGLDYDTLHIVNKIILINATAKKFKNRTKDEENQLSKREVQ